MFTRWLNSLLAGRKKDQSKEERPAHVSTAAPKVEYDSILAVMVSVNSDNAANYIAAVETELRICIDDCRLGEAALPLTMVHEQMHRLKNSIAPMGSPELFHACELLRLEAIGASGRSNLEARYKAIALAALHAVRKYKSSGVGRSS